MKTLLSAVTLLLFANAISFGQIVLYETGWEASPAVPAWNQGNIVPQNSWVGFNDPAGHRVVANGTVGANVNGQDVTTPYGTQFHRFTANPTTSPTDVFYRLAWVDIFVEFEARPPEMNLLTASIDMYVPLVQAADASHYGLELYDGNFYLGSVFIEPSSGSVYLDTGTSLLQSSTEVFEANVWFNLAVTADFETGEMVALLNGVPVPSLSIINPEIPVGTLTDVDLVAANGNTPPTLRSIFSDNFLVLVSAAAPPLPPAKLELTTISRHGYRLSWPAAYGNWIPEFAPEVPSFAWTNVAEPVQTNGQTVFVEFTNSAPFRAFRLVQP